jgi:membrane protein YdbS with pleckstrin-like domain
MASDHGNTPAAWTAVVVGLIGFTVGGIGVMFTPMNKVLFYAGVAIALVGLVIYLTVHKTRTDTGH